MSISRIIGYKLVSLNNTPGCGVMPNGVVPFGVCCTMLYHVFRLKPLILLGYVGLITRRSKVQNPSPATSISKGLRILVGGVKGT